MNHIKATIRKIDREEALSSILQLSFKELYGGLLWHARMMGFSDGWASHAFREIHGGRPSWKDKQTEPICAIGTDIERWCRLRVKRKGGKR
jgi:hypothetical protein